MTFFSHRPQISNFPPIFAVSIHFPSVSRKLFFPPYFYKFPPCFRQIHLLFTYFTCIFFLHTLRVFFLPTLTMMHLCITQCTYWTPLPILFLRYDTSAITTDCNRSQTLSPWLDPPLHRNEMRSLAIDCAGE